MSTKYANLSEEEKTNKRLIQRNWYTRNPERAKELKRKAVMKNYQPTVYVYFREQIPIYVGKTNFPRYRFQHHKKDSRWWNSTLLLLTMTCKDEWEAMEYEGKWGGYYRPTENIDGQRRIKSNNYRDVE